MKKQVAVMLVVMCPLVLSAGCSEKSETKESIPPEYTAVKQAVVRFEKLNSGTVETYDTIKTTPINQAAQDTANRWSFDETSSSKSKLVFKRTGERYEYILDTYQWDEAGETTGHQIDKQIKGIRSFCSNPEERPDDYWIVLDENAWDANPTQQLIAPFLKAEDVEEIQVAAEGGLTKYTFHGGEHYRKRMNELRGSRDNYMVNYHEENFWIDKTGLVVKRTYDTDLDMSMPNTIPETGEEVEERYNYVISEEITLVSYNEKVVIE